MYITIDLENLRFIHKVVDFKTAAHLAWIEARHLPYSIEPLDSKSWLKDMTDLEMRLLYRNTTGQEIHYLGSYLRAILCETAYRLPETEVNPFEAERQSALINEESDSGYEYVFGAYTPSLHGYTIEALTIEPAPNTPEIGAKGHSYYPARNASIAPASAPHAGTATHGAGNNTHSTQRPTKAPRTGNQKEIIWNLADKMWEDVGKPSDLQSVLALRKRIMQELEINNSIKKTTSSTSLGSWQKQRIP